MAKNIRQKGKTKERVPYASKNEIKALTLLVTIVNRDASDVFIDYFKTLESNLQVTIYGKGTVPREIASYLGLSEINNDVVLTFIKKEHVDEAFDYIEKRFELSKRHKGVAFAIDIQSIIGVSVYKYLASITNDK